MTDKTKTFFEELSKMEWLSHLGDCQSPDVCAVTSWQEAEKNCRKPAWESVQLGFSNHLNDLICERSYERFQAIGDTIDELREAVCRLVVETVLPCSGLPDVPTVIKNSIEWDLLLICREVEYEDIIDRKIYTELVFPYYRQGHLVCGWNGMKLKASWSGEPLQGQLIVY